jgi:hypothetical protein
MLLGALTLKMKMEIYTTLVFLVNQKQNIIEDSICHSDLVNQ